MSEQEFENETTTAAVETPPEEKAEKPKRARKPKGERAASGEQPAAEVSGGQPPAAVVEPDSGAPLASTNGNGEPVAVAEPPREQRRRPEQTQAAETIDIRVLKEMKLPDLSKLAKDLSVENATG